MKKKTVFWTVFALAAVAILYLAFAHDYVMTNWVNKDTTEVVTEVPAEEVNREAAEDMVEIDTMIVETADSTAIQVDTLTIK